MPLFSELFPIYLAVKTEDCTDKGWQPNFNNSWYLRLIAMTASTQLLFKNAKLEYNMQ
jgi:hypothetical protein